MINQRRRIVSLLLTSVGCLPIVSVIARPPTEDDSDYLAIRITRILTGMGIPHYSVGFTSTAADSRSSLLGNILPGITESTARSLTDDRIREIIRGNICADYRGGRIQNTRGWLLSTTEIAALKLLAA